LGDSTKQGNFGLLADAALAKQKSTFAGQAAFIGLISGIFAAVAFVFGWISLAVIWPAIPNFTGNQTITDGIILGIFSILMLLVVAFFMAWQSAATIIVCKHHSLENISATIKAVARAALPTATVLFAQILIFVPFLAVFALILALNFNIILYLAPSLLIVLFLILIALRALSFFAVNIALDDGKHLFLSALTQSAKMVIKGGAPVRIFAVTALFTTASIGLFAGLFYAFLTLFGQYPADFIEFLEIFNNPLGVASLLFLSYLITIFITPKTQILAYMLYSAADTASAHSQPGLASRSLATALDIVIVAAVFTACFYGAALLVSGGGFSVSQMNIFAAIIAIIAFFAVYTVYNIYFETFGGGQTPAKRVFGLIVRRADGTNIDFVQSLVRNVLRIVDIFGFVAIAFNKEHRRLGDLLSLAIVEYKSGENTDVS
jgi:uncharacterized RDD family membrane protein YckC